MFEEAQGGSSTFHKSAHLLVRVCASDVGMYFFLPPVMTDVQPRIHLVSSAVQYANQLLEEVKLRYPHLLILDGQDREGSHCFTVQHPHLSHLLSAGHTPVLNPRMVVKAPTAFSSPSSTVTYIFEAHFAPVASGFITCEEHRTRFFELLDSMSPDSQYHLCPGLPSNIISELQIAAKNVRKWRFPFDRVDHVNCLMWFKEEDPSMTGRRSLPLCPFCLELSHYLSRRIRQKNSESPSRVSKRLLPSSRCPLKFLTPRSTKKRLQLALEAKKDSSKAQVLQQYDVNVNEATNEELLTIVSTIQQHTKKELEQMLSEADQAGKGDTLRAVWRQDVMERLSFDRDQQRNGENVRCMYGGVLSNLYCSIFIPTATGKTGNRWSMITIKMGNSLICDYV